MKVFSSRQVVLPDQIGNFAILVENEKISAIVPHEKIPAHADHTDFGYLTILPGLVDSHIHINEPGRTEWEGFRTVTRAAAAGGYTLLVDMPLNCIPSTSSPEALEMKRRAAAGQCLVDWAAWGAVGGDNNDQLLALANAGVAGYKCFLIHPGTEEFTLVSEDELRAALPHLKKSGLPLLVHAELAGPVTSATEKLEDADWRNYKTYLASRPDEAELDAINLLTQLAEEFRTHIHIVHLSTAKALDKLRDAKQRGLPITVETCPHYLHLAAEDISNGATLNKCAPPIRSRENREALWQALRDGAIDLIATDHSPCPPNLKQLESGDFRSAWGGIASVSLALSIIWTEAHRRGFSLTDVARWLSHQPAKLAGLDSRKGQLVAGHDADFTVFGPNTEWTVTPADLHYRHAVSPYLGERLRGKVVSTYLRGEAVFDRGNFSDSHPRGREYTRFSD